MQTTEIIQAVISGLILAFALGAYDFVKKQCCKKEQKEFIRNKITNEMNEILPKKDDDLRFRYKRFIRDMNIVILHRSNCVKSEELYPIIEIFQDAKESSFSPEEKENEDPIGISQSYYGNYKIILNELKNVKWLKIEDRNGS